MNKYEVMFIVRPDMEEAEITKVAAEMKKVLSDKGAKNLEEKAMGQKEWGGGGGGGATGYYFLFTFEAGKEAVTEFDRVARINESLLRHLVVKVED